MDTMAMMKTMSTAEMPVTMDAEMVQDAIMAMNGASMAATMCSATDMQSGEDMMATCAAMCANTAMVADTAMRVMMRPAGTDAESMRAVLTAAVAMGKTCAEECRKHADMHECCRYCALACAEMVEKTETLLGSMAA